jgi:8-amino-7-oxononanoate synthase
MSLAERWAALLEGLRQKNRYRVLSPPGGVDFSSNDYLGYASQTRSQTEFGNDRSKGLSKSGAASRLLRGQHPIWQQVEAVLTGWHGAPAALMMTSGYVANEGLLSTVIEPDDWVASDALNHGSIIDGLRLARAEKFVFRHNDLNHLEEGLRMGARNRSSQRQLFVVTEALFGMDGDLADLAAMVTLAERYEAHVIVDEAHTTGCFGPGGSGYVDQLGLRPWVLATVHTGGKALGVPGAYVAGSTQLKELLVNRCRHFIYTTALPPAIGAWWLDALAQVHGDEVGRAALARKAALFREALVHHGVPPPPLPLSPAERGVEVRGAKYVVPVVVGTDRDALQAAQELRGAGFDIRAIRPPTVAPGTARLRIAIHADHDPETLHRLATAVAQAVRRKSDKP